MSEQPLRILAVVGSLNERSVTRVVLRHLATLLRDAGCEVDVMDFLEQPLPLYNPDLAYASSHFLPLQVRVQLADVYLLGSPDYHGSISSTLKNFLDHFWQEFAGKLFATVVASHEKGLTVTDQLRTVARQCYAWSLPYGISFKEKEDVNNGAIASRALEQRLEMFVQDICTYGALLADQRRLDLTGSNPGFMARHRKNP